MNNKIFGLYVRVTNSVETKITTEEIYGIDNAIERALHVSKCSNVTYVDVVNINDENDADCCVVYATIKNGTIKYLDNTLKEEK